MIWSRYKYKLDSPKLTTIIGSIDGLVCFSNCYADDYSKPIEIFIWNPATKQCLKIPPLPDESDSRYMYDFVGFGYDLTANDFKVMYATCFEHNEPQPLVGYVFSCSSGCWRKIVPSNFLYNDDPVKHYCQSATVINGSPYWWVVLAESLIIITFDVRQEIYRRLPDLGFIDNITGKTFNMMNLRDSLVVMFCDDTVKPSFFSEQVDVYVFNEECSIWNKKSIGPIMTKELTTPSRVYYLVECFTNGDILFVSDDLELTCINLENNTVDNLKSLGKEGYLCLSQCYCGCPYSESLVSVKGMESSNDKDDHEGILFLTPFASNLIRKESRPQRNKEIDEAIEAAEKDVKDMEDDEEAHED
ncbi:hypothetical protein POM88_048009 [Heracleum sosnowskyi]|uniref:F-box associated beta-propeller type 3 domain-containing protein n=1 Tax=Heracleum sosnowskyi TaxID=360622 RepID=A0AAD8M068_9APIA|nr:hypothetical protein POM88_048009 [Heracleum sosnowskyi]